MQSKTEQKVVGGPIISEINRANVQNQDSVTSVGEINLNKKDGDIELNSSKLELKVEVGQKNSGKSECEKSDASQEKLISPKKIISLGASKRILPPALNFKLGSVPEEFFADSWCYKENNQFEFNMAGFLLKKISKHHVATGAAKDRATECRFINFNHEFATFEFIDNQHNEKVITGCHIRIDKTIPKKREDYINLPPFHITLEFSDKKSLHISFDEKGRPVQRDIEERLNKNNPKIMGHILNLANQFINQVKIRNENILFNNNPNNFFNHPVHENKKENFQAKEKDRQAHNHLGNQHPHGEKRNSDFADRKDERKHPKYTVNVDRNFL